MPTAEDFFDASRILSRAAADVRVLNAPVVAAAGPEVLSGGRLGDSLQDFVSEKTSETASIGDELDALADEASNLGLDAEQAEIAAQLGVV